MSKALRFLKGQITKAERRINILDDIDEFQIKIMLDELVADFDEYKNQCRNIIDGGEDENSIETEVKEFELYEERFIRAKSAFLRRLNHGKVQSSEDSPHGDSAQWKDALEKIVSKNEIKLPALKIPVFSGEYTEWVSYRDLFLSVVDANEKLSDVEKMHYLTTTLKGEASSLIAYYPLSAKNYKSAWRALEARYNKPYLITRALIVRFLSADKLDPKSSGMRQLCNLFRETLNAIDNLGEYAQSRDPWLIHLMSTKLNKDLMDKWAHESSDDPHPDIETFLLFLEGECNVVDLIPGPSQCSTMVGPKVPKTFLASVSRCFVCDEEHRISACEKFRKMSVSERERMVKNSKRCLNCLGFGHHIKNCRSKGSCSICHRRHHTTLHLKDNSDNKHIFEFGHTKINQNEGLACVNFGTNLLCATILPTAVVTVRTGHGTYRARALLDSGAQISCITESFVKRAGLRRSRSCIPVRGLGKGLITSKGCTRISVGSCHDQSVNLSIEAYILPELTESLPDSDQNIKGIRTLRERFKLADPEFFVSSKIDLIVGSYHFFELLGTRKWFLKSDRLYIIDSKLGWIVSGTGNSDTNNVMTINSATISSEERLDDILQRFWEMEEPVVQIPISEEDVLCEKIFQENTVRTVDGRYSVDLPWKHPKHQLGDSYNQAFKRFLQLEKKLSTNPELREHYIRFMSEYISLHHMEAVHGEQIVRPIGERYFIPHHGIIQQSHNKKKLRTVFDGSMKSDNGISLNDCLLTGPNLQREISHVLTGFRFRKFVFMTDINKMYRQILVNEQFRHFQRIFWRDDPRKPLMQYDLQTVTYGLGSSPYLAIRTLIQLADDEGEKFPLGAEAIRSCRYMDDFLVGSDDLLELSEIRDQVIGILGTAQMRLSKWASNSIELIRDLPLDEWADPDLAKMDGTITLKTLGIRWCAKSDFFSYDHHQIPTSGDTKRSMLSHGSRIFDPLGWIAPVTVRIKMMFQDTWIRKTGWDESLPSDIMERWKILLSHLGHLNQVRIPRWIHVTEGIEIHGFCDASERAYAAVIYARSISGAGHVHVSLICAKTKLTPIKAISIARLELCGAQLLAKLMKSQEELFQSFNPTYFAWTDSKTVLAWLGSHPKRWNSFVANRCTFIHDLLPEVTWRFVKSGENPADVASRGALPESLIDNRMWWNGPEVLHQLRINPDSLETYDTVVEQKKVEIQVNCAFREYWHSLFERFSSYNRLNRVIAYVLRFQDRLRPGYDREGDLTVDEIKAASFFIIKKEQQYTYFNELSALKNGRDVGRRSSIFSLCPFLDDDELIRVGGRLANSSLSHDKKFPILLPRTTITNLLIEHVHFKYFHSGISLTFSIIRQRFWSPGLRNRVKGVVRRCVICIRHRAATYNPSMGPLPSFRLKPAKPFEISGIDFAGPFKLLPCRGRGRTTLKSYLAIIICMSTKAINLEIVSDLGSEALILALQRFVARRGRCAVMYSDNGRNFLGCSKILDGSRVEICRLIDDPAVKKFLMSGLMKWQFIPPYSPHMGGIWEAGVRSVKACLCRAFGDQVLTIEEMNTAILQIEAILNSRPLGLISEDPENLEILTPSHLLTGHPSVELNLLPEATTSKFPTSLNRYQNLRSRIDSFWRNWRKDYIESLLIKSKWVKGGSNAQEGDLVLVKRRHDPPSFWSRGQILKVYPGTDGVNRIADVFSSGSVSKESVRNLIPLVLKRDASTGGDCSELVRSPD